MVPVSVADLPLFQAASLSLSLSLSLLTIQFYVGQAPEYRVSPSEGCRPQRFKVSEVW